MASVLSRLLAYARSQIGYAESPAGSNKTKFGAAYGMNGVAWCGIFVSECADEVGLIAAKVIPKYAYTPTGAQWFKDKGQWGSTPRTGAIVFFDIAGMGRISHTGIVESVNSDGSFLAIEGNTNGSGSRTGGEVWRQKRKNVGKLGGFGYPNYPVDAPAPAPAAPQSQQAPAPAPPSKPAYPGLLQQGSKGAAVRTLQLRLNDHLRGQKMAEISTDGDFGPNTKKAVVWFQGTQGLSKDGQCGPNTWGHLW